MLKLYESMERRYAREQETHDDIHAKLQEHEVQVSDLLVDKEWWTSSEQAAKKQVERQETRFKEEIHMLQLQSEKADFDCGSNGAEFGS